MPGRVAWLAVVACLACLGGTARAEEARRVLPIAALEDPGGAMTADQARAADAQGRFRPLGSGGLRAGYTRSAWWLRLDLPASQAPAIAEIGAPILDRVEWHGEGAAPLLAGDTVPIAQRSLASRLAIFPVPAGPARRVYVRISGVSPVNAAVTLWSDRAFADAAQREQIWSGVFYGGLIFAFAYNFVLFLVLRDRGYGAYLLYLGPLILFHARLQGYADAILFPDWPALANPVLFVAAAAFIAGGAAFQRTFLSTRREQPVLDRLFLAAQIGAGALVLLHLAFDARALGPPLLALGGLVSILSAVAILRAFFRGFRPARYLVASVAYLIPSQIVTVLAFVGVVEPNWFTEHANRIGAALEAVLFSLALADRVGLVEAARARAVRDLAEARGRFARELIDSQEADRRRIAGELHDAVGQNLAVLRNRLARAPAGEEGELARLAGETTEQVRGIARGLHPPELDRLGLEAATRAMLERVFAGSGISWNAALAPLEAGLPRERHIHLFRILQEAATNTLRHSGAARFEAVAHAAGGGLALAIRDDGRGRAAGAAPGFGLTGMAERAALIGARFSAQGDAGMSLEFAWEARPA